MTIIQGPPNYEVWLCTDRGRPIKPLSPIAFEYVLSLDDIGAFSLLLPGDFPYNLIQVDRQIRFFRRHRRRSAMELDQVGLLRRARYETNDLGETTLRLSGPDIQELLSRRIVAYAAGETEATMAKAADNGMKDIFDTNFVIPEDTARDISDYGVSTQQDLGDGPTIEKAFSWRYVIDVLRDLQEASRTAGTEVFYRLVWQGINADHSLNLQFQTFTGQPGRDLTYPNTQMVFGLEYGNLTFPALEIDHTNEINYVYAAGQGEGTNRVIAEVSDAARIAKSIWNRREGFKDARNETTTNGVTAAGNAMLAQYRPKERFSGTVIDTDFTAYGSGWRLGDKLSVSYVGRQFDEILRKVAVKVDADGETIQGAFEGGRLITDPVIDEIVGNYAKMRALLAELASREDTKYRGTKATLFTTTDLPQHGQYGLQTASNQVQINFNGTIRAMSTVLAT